MKHQTSDQLLGEIRRLCQNKLPGDQIDAVADEVRAHLDAAVQARLELGVPAQDAELEAVASFGSAKDFVASLASKNGARRANIKVAWTMGLILLLSLMACVQGAGGSAFDGWMEASIYVTAVWSLWTGLTFRGYVMRKFAKAFLVSIPIASILFTFALVGTPRPTSLYLRWYLHGSHDMSSWRKADEARFLDLKANVLLSIKSHPAPYQVPIIWEYERVIYKQAASKEQALQMLEGVERKTRNTWASQAIESRRSADNDQRLLNTPFLLNALFLLPLAACSTSVFALMVSLGYSIGALVRRLTRIRFPTNGRGVA